MGMPLRTTTMNIAVAFIALLAAAAAASVVPIGTVAAVPAADGLRSRRVGPVGARGLVGRADCGCASVGQADYRGSISTTESGAECERWESGYNERFPDAGLEENYCRNPTGYRGAWCWAGRFEFCSIPECSDCAHRVTDVACEGPRGGPCAPAPGEGSPRFCNYQLGPDAGGYCVECAVGRVMDKTGSMTVSGAKDYDDKCACPTPCGEGSFCSRMRIGCLPCLQWGLDHALLCDRLEFSSAAVGECKEKCLPRTCRLSSECDEVEDYGSDYDYDDFDDTYFCDFTQSENSDNGNAQIGTCEPCAGLLSTEECGARGASPLGARECVERCEGVMPPSCSTNEDCKDVVGHAYDKSWVVDDRSFFCNLEWHACEVCPRDQCGIGARDGTSLENCVLSCNTECSNVTEGVLSVGGLAIGDSTALSKGASYVVSVSSLTSVSGPLIECQTQGEAATCPDDAPTNFVCLFPEADWWDQDQLLTECKESGGIAMAYTYQNGLHEKVRTSLEPIPALGLNSRDTQGLLGNGLGLNTKVKTWVKEECYVGCSDRVPCPSSLEAFYCNYNKDNFGTCKMCLPDENEAEQTNECFFSGLSLRGAQNCAETCQSTLAASSCKFCGEGISASDLKSAPKGEPVCDFCPGGLQRSNNDQVIPFLGSDTTCEKMNQFFLSYRIAEDNPNCLLAVNFNYVCGCPGSGYSGADSALKKQALVWIPRISAMLSFVGSFAIMVDILRHPTKRAKTKERLLVMMSAFDLVGSMAYAFTSLPIPIKYLIEGSRGSAVTCSVQGFFIQIGTIAALFNGSLASYFYCVVKLSWVESKIKEIRHWLFICPIVVGLVFACAGIPFYGMLNVYCNNEESWWPEIPVIVAIVIATCLYASMFWDVYKVEQASNAYAVGGGQGNPMSAAVFWQSCWYLLPFYLTWLPYVALQFMWSSGTGYSAYGFVMLACTLVPLQGFSNCMVYFHKRLHKKLRAVTHGVSSRFQSKWHSMTTRGTGAAEANIGEEARNNERE